MRCHLGTTSLKCVCLCVSGWVGEGLSLCALFCVGYSVEKSPHSLSLFCWWTTLAKRAEGQTAEITTAPEACDSRPRPFCLDNYNQHRKPWKWTGSRKWPSVGMIGHFKLLLEMSFFSDYDVEGNCLHWELDFKKMLFFFVSLSRSVLEGYFLLVSSLVMNQSWAVNQDQLIP